MKIKQGHTLYWVDWGHGRDVAPQVKQYSVGLPYGDGYDYLGKLFASRRRALKWLRGGGHRGENAE